MSTNEKIKPSQAYADGYDKGFTIVDYKDEDVEHFKKQALRKLKDLDEPRAWYAGFLRGIEDSEVKLPAPAAGRGTIELPPSWGKKKT